MSLSERHYAAPFSPSGVFPAGTKWLLGVNIALFLIKVLAALFAGQPALDFFRHLYLIPAEAVGKLYIWQFATYMFLHADIMHLIFNMLALYFFGQMLEQVWGTRAFLKYYFLCGLGSAFFVTLADYLFGVPTGATLGASGAVLGCLLAGAMLFPDLVILFFFVYPLKLKYVAWIYGVIAFVGSISGSGSTVSHVAHLGGMLVGYAYLKSPKGAFGKLPNWGQWYKDWKTQRAKKKFQVYMRKREANQDRRVH